MLIPVIIEQILNTSIGMINMLMIANIAFIGTGAVAAIGLVDSLNNLFFNVFTALSTGIMVVVSQCIGRGDIQEARSASAQAYSAAILAAIITAIPLLLFGRPILDALYGSSEEMVLEMAAVYLLFSAISYPFLAASQTAFGIVRAQGDSRSPMISSVIGNFFNILVGAILIYGLDWGILGVSIGMLTARVVMAILISMSMWRKNNWRALEGFTLRFKKAQMIPVLNIGVPSGLDSAMFNGGKLVVATFMSGMGTAAMAANGIVNNLFGFINVPGNSISTITVPIIGYFFGAKRYKTTRQYMIRLTLMAMGTVGVVSAILFPFMPALLSLYTNDPEVQRVSLSVLSMVLICMPLFWPASFVTPSAVRATGDVKFNTIVSMVSMWTFRVFGGYVIGVQWGWGVEGIWISMIIDWAVRSIFYLYRALSNKWLKHPEESIEPI